MQASPLVWDEKLTASAKKWAATCTFGLSGTPGVGESLGFGYRTFPDAVTAWYSQVRTWTVTVWACFEHMLRPVGLVCVNTLLIVMSVCPH